MAAISVTNIKVLNNPCPLNAPFLFEIHFEALQALKHDVEWRVVYVGSGEHHGAHTSPQRDKALPASAVKKEGSGMQADGEGPRATGTGSSAKKPPRRGADYVLDSVLLGPIERGALAFEFAVSAPDFTEVRLLLFPFCVALERNEERFLYFLIFFRPLPAAFFYLTASDGPGERGGDAGSTCLRAV